MTNHVIDNSSRDLKKTILWQYDNAYNLIRLFMALNDYYTAAVDRFWTAWRDDVLGIDTCNDFGAAMWGAIIGAKRPIIYGPNENNAMVNRPVDLSTYRNIIKATFFFLNSTSSIADIMRYVEILFTPSWEGAKCGVVVTTNNELDLTYEKSEFYDEMPYDLKAVYEQLGDDYLVYPLGIRKNTAVNATIFGFKGQERLNPTAPPIGYIGGYYKNFDTESTFEKNDSVLYEHPTRGPLLYVCREDFDKAEDGVETFEDAEKYLTAYLDSATSRFGAEWLARNVLKLRVYGGFCGTGDGDEYEVAMPYAAGDSVFHDGREYVCMADISAAENTGWDYISALFKPTFIGTTLSYDAETIDSKGYIPTPW